MKRLLLLVWLGLMLAGPLLPAQTPEPATKPAGRYLLVVETSSAMQRRARAVQEAMQALLRYDLNGQLRQGDTLGIWTFNEELYTGRFPLEVWAPERRESAARNVMEFLKQQRYEKQTRLEEMLSELDRVVKGSENLTVLLVSAGEKEIKGTPFDQQINTVYAQWRREMQRKRMPFLTVLRAKRGVIVSCTVNMAPWPVEFPAFPPEPPPTVAAKPPQDAPAKKTPPVPPPRPHAPLILDMSKSAKTELTETAKTEIAPAGPNSTPAPTAVATATPAPKIESVETPAPVPKPPATLPANATATGQVQAAAPPQPAVEARLPVVERAEGPQSPPVQPAPIPSPKPESPPAGSTKDATPPPPVVPPPGAATPTVETLAIEQARQQLKQKATELAAEQMKVQPAAPEPPAPKPVEPVAPPTPEVKLAAAQTTAQEPVTPLPPEIKPAITQAATHEPITPPDDSTVVAHPPEAKPALPESPPAQTAVTTPPETIFTGKAFLAAAFALLAVAAGLLVLLLRRPRAAPPASLITRSMERKEK